MAYDTDNIFAKILREELPCNKVYEDEHVLAFEDIEPVAPVHVLVIPKGEYVSFDDFMTAAPQDLIQGFFAGVQKVASQLKLQENGYRIISNHGEDAGQLVPHFHVHVVAGKRLDGLVAE
ncbi:MAG: histidine triad nucleotide-binding protein [Rickettsiales bacterium]